MEAGTASPHFELPQAGRPQPGRPACLLAELFEAHAPLVLGTCHGMLRDRYEAEDAAQQTFLSAYAVLLSGTVPRDPPAWLVTIARNECRTRIQQQMRRPLPVVEAYAETSDPADEAARAAEVESLRRALAELPRRQRHAFVLREFSGLSYHELAVALGVSAPAVESLLFRARQRLRESLRAAAAAAMSVPAGIRDFLGQLTAAPADTPATVAKLGSAPVLAKLASIGAGAAFLTAGPTSVLPVAHQRAVAAPPLRVVAPALRSPSPRTADADASPPLAVTREAGEEEVQHAAPAADRRRGKPAERATATPEPEPEPEPASPSSGRDGGSDTSEPSPSSGPTVIVASETEGSHEGEGSPGDGSIVDSSGSGDSGALGGSSGSGGSGGSTDIGKDGSGSGTH